LKNEDCGTLKTHQVWPTSVKKMEKRLFQITFLTHFLLIPVTQNLIAGTLSIIIVQYK